MGSARGACCAGGAGVRVACGVSRERRLAAWAYGVRVACGARWLALGGASVWRVACGGGGRRALCERRGCGKCGRRVRRRMGACRVLRRRRVYHTGDVWHAARATRGAGCASAVYGRWRVACCAEGADVTCGVLLGSCVTCCMAARWMAQVRQAGERRAVAHGTTCGALSGSRAVCCLVTQRIARAVRGCGVVRAEGARWKACRTGAVARRGRRRRVEWRVAWKSDGVLRGLFGRWRGPVCGRVSSARAVRTSCDA